MPLLGSAAMVLSFDVDPAAVEEHDRWHTHEHLPERLSIPGFLRGTRWTAIGDGPRYLVLYEVRTLQTLASAPYRARLDQPTPWTAAMMPHYRGMIRGLCTVVGSFGLGAGGHAALIRFAPAGASGSEADRWLLEDELPAVPSAAWLGSAHLLRGAQQAAMTNEQRIRGADRSVDSAIIVTGYDGSAVAARADALGAGLRSRSAADVAVATYALAYSLAATEIAGA